MSEQPQDFDAAISKFLSEGESDQAVRHFAQATASYYNELVAAGVDVEDAMTLTGYWQGQLIQTTFQQTAQEQMQNQLTGLIDLLARLAEDGEDS